MSALAELERLAREMREEYAAAARRHEERLNDLAEKLDELVKANEGLGDG